MLLQSHWPDREQALGPPAHPPLALGNWGSTNKAEFIMEKDGVSYELEELGHLC